MYAIRLRSGANAGAAGLGPMLRRLSGANPPCGRSRLRCFRWGRCDTSGLAFDVRQEDPVPFPASVTLAHALGPPTASLVGSGSQHRATRTAER